MHLDDETRKRAEDLAGQIADVARSGLALPGTVTSRLTRCGRPGCRCGADPPRPHGPYWSWTRKIDNKTVTRYLSEEIHAEYGSWFENAKKLRQLVTELEKLGLTVLENDDRTRR
ncbi:MAG: DUF6788 family protein [Acidimicrobiales bacterium]